VPQAPLGHCTRTENYALVALIGPSVPSTSFLFADVRAGRASRSLVFIHSLIYLGRRIESDKDLHERRVRAGGVFASVKRCSLPPIRSSASGRSRHLVARNPLGNGARLFAHQPFLAQAPPMLAERLEGPVSGLQETKCRVLMGLTTAPHNSSAGSSSRSLEGCRAGSAPRHHLAGHVSVSGALATRQKPAD
jgi:hypothetical protein